MAKHKIFPEGNGNSDRQFHQNAAQFRRGKKLIEAATLGAKRGAVNMVGPRQGIVPKGSNVVASEPYSGEGFSS